MAGEQVDDLTFFSSACKCLASDVAMQVTTDAVQLLGGYGYVNRHRRRAACVYSLIRPPRTGFRRICPVSMSVRVAR